MRFKTSILKFGGVIVLAWETICCDPDVTWAPNKTPWRPDLDLFEFCWIFGFPWNQLWSHFADDVFQVWAIKFKYSFHSRVCFLMIWDQTWHQDAPPGCA